VKKTEKVYGILYELPQVILLNESGIGTAEYAARTCYDSFDKSENSELREFHRLIEAEEDADPSVLKKLEDSELLRQLAWVHHHHSIIEHATLTYLVRGTSRGVLQEHARHRIQSISVRSTRYTMGGVLNAYVAARAVGDLFEHGFETQKEWFFETLSELDMFVTVDPGYMKLECNEIFSKLLFQEKELGWEEFLRLALSKDGLSAYQKTKHENFFELLYALNEAKGKRNVGDAFKHIVSDNWKVDMVVTFNLRSLKNYFDLRDSGAAYFQIRWLAKAMKEATPEKYLRLIDKAYKDA